MMKIIDDQDEAEGGTTIHTSIIDEVVMDMCRSLPPGTTVNLDNWYTSVQSAVD